MDVTTASTSTSVPVATAASRSSGTKLSAGIVMRASSATATTSDRLSKVSSYSAFTSRREKVDAVLARPLEKTYTLPSSIMAWKRSTASRKKVARISVPSSSSRVTLKREPWLLGPLFHVLISLLCVTRARMCQLLLYGLRLLRGMQGVVSAARIVAPELGAAAAVDEVAVLDAIAAVEALCTGCGLPITPCSRRTTRALSTITIGTPFGELCVNCNSCTTLHGTTAPSSTSLFNCPAIMPDILCCPSDRTTR
mmetsp:Transcript_1163/g.3366  ORF Transcript_1163/g.3366 Transcript_1163/m.3366 type:complete len:253 (+) Transcript_1163:981-1739(+)